MQVISLDGIWEFSFYPQKFYEDVWNTDFSAADIMCVPGAFDMLPDYYCQRGTGLYRRTFELAEDVKNAFIRVHGMGLRCCFAIDGKMVGSSQLSYSLLEIPTGALNAGEHVITAALDNNFDPQKVKLFNPNYDFYAHGGFYHGIELKLQRDEWELDRVLVRTLCIKTGTVELEFIFKGEAPADFSAQIAFDHNSLAEYEVKNRRLTLQVVDFKLWSVEEPNLHTLTAMVNARCVKERFGLRTVEAGKKSLLLNGKPVYLKGFNRHEAHLEFGAATGEALMLADLQNMRKMHCNFVRGAHYPQSQKFLDMCDELGFLVWEESLGWGNPAEQMSDPEYQDLQLEQTLLMVQNSFNHPSVIIWGFQNENASNTGIGRDFNTRLIRAIKAQDSKRLVTFACNRGKDDLSNNESDLIAYNTYPAWINTEALDSNMAEDMRRDRDAILEYLRKTYGEDKPIIVSEMGTCGVYNAHDPAAAQWTEEFQAEYLENVIDTVFASDEICGLTIWHLADTRSYLRSGSAIRVKPFAQNLAGVFDGYRRAKLAAKVVETRFERK